MERTEKLKLVADIRAASARLGRAKTDDSKTKIKAEINALKTQITGEDYAPEVIIPSSRDSLLAGKSAFLEIVNFIPKNQRIVIGDMLKNSEEKEGYAEIMIGLKKTIDSMPESYETDGQGRKAIVQLHYFTGGSDWYILEKDVSGGTHKQAFGYADLGQGELGYISIEELTNNASIELDLHWSPKSLGSVLGEDESEDETHEDVDDPEDENHDAQAEIDDAVALIMKPYGSDLEELEQAINFLKALDGEGDLEAKYRFNLETAEQVLSGRMSAKSNEKENAIKNFATATDLELNDRETYLRGMNDDDRTYAESEEWSLIIEEQSNRQRGVSSKDSEAKNNDWFSTFDEAELALTGIGYIKSSSNTFTKSGKKDALIKEAGVARGGFVHVVRTDEEIFSDKLGAIASATGRDKGDIYSQYKTNEEKHGKEEADRLLDVTYAKLESYQARLDTLKVQTIDDVEAYNEAIDELMEELESKGLTEQYDADLTEVLDRVDAIIEAAGV